MRILRNIGALATCRAEGGQGDIHVIERGAVVWQDDTIMWVGREAELPMVHETAESEDCGGRLVVPGLVDCHTHLAFGGWRAGSSSGASAGSRISTSRSRAAASPPPCARRGRRARTSWRVVRSWRSPRCGN